MDVRQAIETRLSIRQYEEAAVPSEHMDLLLRSLQLAPSAANRQNREFVLVGDTDLKARLVSICHGQRFVGECSYFIAALADPAQRWHQVDVSIALTNFTLQAVELGYGTCWIGDFDEDRVKELLRIPGGKRVVVCMAFGVPRGRHLPRGRKEIREFVHLDRHGNPWRTAP